MHTDRIDNDTSLANGHLRALEQWWIAISNQIRTGTLASLPSSKYEHDISQCEPLGDSMPWISPRCRSVLGEPESLTRQHEAQCWSRMKDESHEERRGLREEQQGHQLGWDLEWDQFCVPPLVHVPPPWNGGHAKPEDYLQTITYCSCV